MSKIQIDKQLCIGCGNCVDMAPKSFKMGEDGKSEVIEPVDDGDQIIQNAITGCPVGAISLKGEQ